MESSLINTSYSRFEQVYNQIFRVVKQHKWTSISAAVLLSISMIIKERILKPPKHLRHIPYQSYFGVLWASFREDIYYKISRQIMLPYINSNNGYNGMYTRVGRAGWTVHVNDAEAIKYILMKHELYPRVQPFNFTTGTLANKFFELPGLVFSQGKEWKDQRTLANIFIRAPKPVQLVGDLTSKMFNIMEPKDGVVDIRFWLSRLVFDIMGISLLDTTLPCHEFNTLDGLNVDYQQSMEILNTELQRPLYFNFPTFEKRIKSHLPKRLQFFDEAEHRINSISKFVEERVKEVNHKIYKNPYPSNEKDFLTVMVEGLLNSKESMLSVDLFVADIVFLFTTAHGATFANLSYAMYFLAKYPDIQQRARDQVISVLGSGPGDVTPTAEQLSDMPYITQILKETLRLNTNIVESIPRVCTVDSVLGGVFVPKGTMIAFDIHNMHNNEHYWKNPSEFDPDRFADGGEAFKLKGEGMKFLAFGGGTRQCLGIKYTISVQSVILIMMLRKYRWSLPENDIHKKDFVASGVMTVIPKSMVIHIDETYY